MFVEKSFILTANDNKRVIQSDNYSTYITFSDMEDQFDGLWSHGFHIFKSIYINNKKAGSKKRVTPFKCELHYAKSSKLTVMLFKNNQGVLLDAERSTYVTQRVDTKKRPVVTYEFLCKSNFKFIEYDRNIIYLEYMHPERSGFGTERLYVGLAVDREFIIAHPLITETGFSVTVVNTSKSKKNPALYMLYSNNYNTLKKNLECNIERQDVLIKQHINNSLLPLKYIDCKTGNKEIDRALVYSVISGSSFIMTKNNQIGIWAGFPWFDNGWGRDTFVALPGVALVTGRYEVASHIIGNFLKYQNIDPVSKDYGKIPNVIFNEETILYNTGDGTPLLIRELYEYFLYTNDVAAVMSVWNNVIRAIDEVYMKHKDADNFISNEDADDWMDARIKGEDAYSPRGDKQIEIQVLWFVALHAVINIASEILKRKEEYKPVLENINIDELKAKRDLYKVEAEKLQTSFCKKFLSVNPPYLYDHVNSDGFQDQRVRPNPLLALYYNDLIGIPELVDKNTALKAFKYITAHCVFEHGVASLDKNDEDFHPQHVTDMHHKDAAYHNGALWGWLSGAFIHAAVKFGLENFAFAQTKLLSKELLYGATPGTLSELFDAYRKNGKINTSGTYSQAWSISEFTRTFYQEYLGIKPDVPQRKLYITPAFPAELDNFDVRIRYGIYEHLSIHMKAYKNRSSISFIEVRSLDIVKPIEIVIRINLGCSKNVLCNEYKVIQFRVLLKSSGAQLKVDFDSLEQNRIKLKDLFISNNCELVAMGTDTLSYAEDVGVNLAYAADITDEELASYRCSTEKDYLDKKILGDRFDPVERYK